MNRTMNPVQKVVPEFKFTKAHSELTHKGLILHTVHSKDADISRLQFEFDAGYAHQKKSLVAYLCVKMLNKGTSDYTSKEINEQFDMAGAFWDAECMADKFVLTLHCIPNNLHKVLPMVREILKSSVFPELEFQQLLSISKQKFLINSQKVSFLAKQLFIERLYENDHAYNNTIKLKDFDNIQREDILDFYNNYIKRARFDIYASACVNKEVRSAIDAFIDGFSIEIGHPQQALLNVEDPTFKTREIEFKEMPGFQQNAIRIGSTVIGRNHDDYASLYFTNVLLGGFFGSRLMRNIREEKGYTYGIHSGIANNDHSSYFFIGTEVGNEYVNDTLKEIEAELDRLKEGEIHKDELQLVKNYTLGSIMRGFDGAFNTMDRYRSLKKLDFNYTYYEHLIDEIRSLNADKVHIVAKKYLNWEQMIKIVVGSKE